jgi:hypothetical protein
MQKETNKQTEKERQQGDIKRMKERKKGRKL